MKRPQRTSSTGTGSLRQFEWSTYRSNQFLIGGIARSDSVKLHDLIDAIEPGYREAVIAVEPDSQVRLNLPRWQSVCKMAHFPVAALLGLERAAWSSPSRYPNHFKTKFVYLS
jgi:hypothetical protein